MVVLPADWLLVIFFQSVQVEAVPPRSSDAAEEGGGAAWPQETFLLAAAGAGMGWGRGTGSTQNSAQRAGLSGCPNRESRPSPLGAISCRWHRVGSLFGCTLIVSAI